VLWHCWLGDRKGIQPVKTRVTGTVYRTKLKTSVSQKKTKKHTNRSTGVDHCFIPREQTLENSSHRHTFFTFRATWVAFGLALVSCGGQSNEDAFGIFRRFPRPASLSDSCSSSLPSSHSRSLPCSSHCLSKPKSHHYCIRTGKSTEFETNITNVLCHIINRLHMSVICKMGL